MKHRHNMNCQDILKNLNDYIDGELDRQLCTDIEAHIDSCPNCQIVVNTLKKTIQLYQMTSEKIDFPIEARKRLYKRLDLDAYARKE